MSTDPGPTNAVIETGAQSIAPLARAHGFHTVQSIWDDPANAALKQRRVNPHTLAAGDVVTVPVLDPKVDSKAVNQTHLFTLTADEMLLNIRLENEARKPLAKRAFRLVFALRGNVGGTPKVQEPLFGVTDADGALKAEIPTAASEGELRLHAAETTDSPIVAAIRLFIAALDPASTVRGQRSRLNNMGYFAGFTDADAQQLKWAIEEFQFDHGIKPTGDSADAKTFNRIAHEHGDLLASEKVP